MDSVSGDGEMGTIYEPLGTPLHIITSANRGPILIVVTIPLLIVATLTAAVRLWTVHSVTRSLGPSEATIIAAIAFAIGYTASLNLAIDAGFGTASDGLADSQVERLSQQYYASNLLLILSLTCAKSSVVLFFIKIIGWKTMWKLGRYTSQGVLLYTVLWGVASLFATAFQCSPVRWALGPDDTTTCSDQYAIQVGIRVADVLSDLVITVLPILLVRILQTTRKSRFIVVVLFGIRITTIVPAIISISALSPLYAAPVSDRPLRAITPAIWTSVWLFLSIVTACIPSIKQFLADWSAGLAGAVINEGIDEGPHGFTYGSRSQPGKKGVFESASLSNTGGGGRSGTPLAQKLGLMRSGRAAVVSVSRGSQGSVTGKGGGSESVRGLTEGVILHTTDYAVEYEDHEMVTMGRDGSTTSSGVDGGGMVRTRS